MAPDVEKIIQSISLGDQDAVQLLLDSYNTQYAECFFFNTEAQERKKFRKNKIRDCASNSDSDIDSDDKRPNLLLRELQDLAAALLCFVGGQLQPAVLRACLHTLRILSRDRRALGPMVTDSSLLTLTHLGGINLLLQGLWESLKQGIWSGAPPTGQFYKLRLLFLLTALRPELRLQLQQERGVFVLTSALEQCLVLRWADGNQLITDSTSVSKEVSQDVIEILKTIFNVAHRFYRQQEEATLYRRLAAVLRHCLLLSCDGADTMEELQHTVNILSALPLTCLDVMLAVPVGQASHQYEGVNMDCVHALLLFMDRRLNRQGQKLKEKLTPVLSLLTESSRVHRETRHYLRQKILPPLKDVAVRPEQDSTLRGQLVRLMTHVDTDVKDCAAELLFVLCKENSRFVKYTGYGNAAGLLAARGLLNGRRNSGDGQFASHYSSDSDSDTEEYRQVRSKINLVTGRVEAEQPNPMEGMTEEEKEEEACRLICMINRLSDQIIQPMGVTRDGRLAPLWGQMRSCTEEKEEEEDEYEEEEQGLSSMPQGLKDKTMK
uniref:Synembryn n=1 Tax=Xiphophorus couchianus TaxID=32473 RepID=A0A3B5LL49_9TELE